MYIVKYTVLGQEFSVGPWAYEEACYQLADIRGYEGVTAARLVSL